MQQLIPARMRDTRHPHAPVKPCTLSMHATPHLLTMRGPMQCSDAGGVSAWVPCAAGWKQLSGLTHSQASRTGISERLSSHEASYLQPQLSDSGVGVLGQSSSTAALPDVAQHPSAVSTGFSSASGPLVDLGRGSRDASQGLDQATSSGQASGALEELGVPDMHDGRSDDSDSQLEAAAAQEDAMQRAGR